jgi:hypothetical protein
MPSWVLGVGSNPGPLAPKACALPMRHSTYVNLELVKVFNCFKNNRRTLHPNKSKFLIHSRDKLISIKLDSKNISRCGYSRQE